MWEFLPAAFSSPRRQQWIVYRPLHQSAMNELVNGIRQDPQRQLIPVCMLLVSLFFRTTMRSMQTVPLLTRSSP